MCKTCGCAKGAGSRLEFHIGTDGRSLDAGALHARLLGSPGIVNVELDMTAGKIMIDFLPDQSSSQDVIHLVSSSGCDILSVSETDPTHRHGIAIFLRRLIGK